MEQRDVVATKVNKFLNTIIAQALVLLGVKDRTPISMDARTNKLKSCKIKNGRVIALEANIQDLMTNIASMVGNGLPCPWDD